MKKLIIIILLSLLPNIFINAQDFTKLKVEMGALYGIPTDALFTAGIGGYFHPSYYLSDKINVGLKGEIAIIGSASETSLSLAAMNSYLATFSFYFATSKVRPYVGIGVGMYQLGSVSLSATTGGADIGDKYGFAPTFGIDLSHFTIKTSYNYIFEAETKNYVSIGIGVFFGGGKKGGGSSKTKDGFIDFGIEDDE